MTTSTIPEPDPREHQHLMVLIEGLLREGRSEREIEAIVRSITGEPAPTRTWPKPGIRLLNWARGGFPLRPQIDRA